MGLCPKLGDGLPFRRGSGKEPLLHTCGEASPGFGAEPQLLAYMIQSSQTVSSRVVKFVCIQFGGWAAEPERPEVSPAKPRTAAHRAKLESDKFGDESGETKPVV